MTERWLEQVREAAAKRARAAEMRKQMLERRRKGLILRHATKLARNRTPVVEQLPRMTTQDS